MSGTFRTGGVVSLPIKDMPTLERVNEMEAIFQSFHDKEIDKMMNSFYVRVASIFPTKMYQAMIQHCRRTSGTRILFSTMVSFAEGFYEFEGFPVISIYPIFGLYGLASGNLSNTKINHGTYIY